MSHLSAGSKLLNFVDVIGIKHELRKSYNGSSAYADSSQMCRDPVFNADKRSSGSHAYDHELGFALCKISASHAVCGKLINLICRQTVYRLLYAGTSHARKIYLLYII